MEKESFEGNIIIRQPGNMAYETFIRLNPNTVVKLSDVIEMMEKIVGKSITNYN